MSDLGNKEIMAENIRFYMEKAGKTRTEVCRDLGIKYTTFTDWVNGNAYPRIDKIEKLADYFGISKSDLVESRSRSLQRIEADIRNKAAELDRILGKLTNALNQLGRIAEDDWVDYVPDRNSELYPLDAFEDVSDMLDIELKKVISKSQNNATVLGQLEKIIKQLDV